MKHGLIATLVWLTLTLFITGCGADPAPSLTVQGSSSSTASTSSSVFFRVMDYLIPSVLAETFAGSPTSLSFTVFRFFISLNADCTSPQEVATLGSSGQLIDFYQSPTLFAASPAAGTYNCLAIEANDLLAFTPDSTAAAAFAGCVAGTEGSGDLYRDGEGDDGNWKDTTGAGIDATGSNTSPGVDKVVFYATTDSAAAQAGAMGLHENQILPLSAALTVPGASVFYADFNNGISGDATRCALENGGLGFR